MAQIIDHRDLLNSYRPGDHLASERIVRLYQNEVTRTAFLLTAAADGAVLLARDTFLSFFRRLMRGNVPDDPRYGLLQSLGRCYLSDPEGDDRDNGDRPASALAGMVAFDTGEPQHYRVDDERSRALDSLALLDRRTRLGLVLRDFNALDEEPVCQILDETPFALRDRLQPARNRLLDSAGTHSDRSVRELLVNAATSAPRPELWPEVAGPLEDVFAEEDERRQRYTYAAAGAVALLLFIAGLWLFNVFPFGGGGDDDGQAAVASAGPTATSTATPEPTVTPTPVPDLSSYAILQGDVPGYLLMRLRGMQGGDQDSESGIYDRDTGTFTPFASDGLPQPSPDGRLLVGFTENEAGAGDGILLLVALDSQSGERVWQAELPEGVFTLAMTGERVYVVTSIQEMTDGIGADYPELLEFDLETGEQTNSWPDLVPSLMAMVSDFIRVTLHAAPDGNRLYVVLHEFASETSNGASRTLASYSLPEMTFESSSVQTDSLDGNLIAADFSFIDAHVTPDGKHIYNIDSDEDVVKFRSSNAEDDIDVELFFTRERARNEDLRWIVSNDGRYLYIVAPERGEAAVVDLLARQVVRSFPVAFSAESGAVQERFAYQFPFGEGFANGLTLSHDGRYLFIAGAVSDDVFTGFVEQSMLWTIDLSTWTVVRGQELPGRILNLSDINGQVAVLTERFEGETGPTNRLLTVDPETGEVVSEYTGEGLPDWVQSFYAFSLADYYRFNYARAPAVDQDAYADVELESTLPRVTVFPSDDPTPAGNAVNLALRVLNPVDGQKIIEPLPGVRFDLDSTVVIRLSHEDGAADEVILIANRIDPSEYRASATLEETGYWHAEITITGADGRSWSQYVPRVFQIVPSWEATDGNRYILRLETDPAEPRVDEVAQITVRFVEVDTGDPLPEGVEIVDEFPEQVRARFVWEQDGQASEVLTLNDEGVYVGERSLWMAGTWDAVVEIRFEDGEQFSVEAGSVNVGS